MFDYSFTRILESVLYLVFFKSIVEDYADTYQKDCEAGICEVGIVMLNLLDEVVEGHELCQPPSERGKNTVPHQRAEDVNTQNVPMFIFARPAGMDISWRTAGINRPTNVDIAPWSSK